MERRLRQQRIAALTHDNPPLPNFSRFHEAFRSSPYSDTREERLRKAFFMSYKDELCEYLKLSSLRKHVAAEREVVSAMFVIPYPPGFPVLVPGQVINEATLAFMQALDTREIHGYRPELGFRVFTEEALQAALVEETVAQPTLSRDAMYTPEEVLSAGQGVLQSASEGK